MSPTEAAISRASRSITNCAAGSLLVSIPRLTSCLASAAWSWGDFFAYSSLNRSFRTLSFSFCAAASGSAAFSCGEAPRARIAAAIHLASTMLFRPILGERVDQVARRAAVPGQHPVAEHQRLSRLEHDFLRGDDAGVQH